MEQMLRAIFLILSIFILVPSHLVWAEEEGVERAMVRTFLEDYARNRGTPVDWVSLRDAILRLGDLEIKECEEMMVEILGLTGELKLKEGSPLPGTMSPMDMLKAAALRYLVKIGASGRGPEIEKVYRGTRNQVLKGMARETLESLGVRFSREDKGGPD